MSAPARFIVFEGGEGAGKSTQISFLAERLMSVGIACITTREPGGTPQGEDLRALFVRGESDRWSALAEALIAYAARQEHLERLIRPSLAAGRWVICDRFSLSTKVYQGHVGGVSSYFLGALDAEIVGKTQPDLTVLLDVDPSTGVSRARGRTGAGAEETRFEDKNLAFHVKLREGFLKAAKEKEGHVVVVASDAPKDKVAEQIWSAVVARFDELA